MPRRVINECAQKRRGPQGQNKHEAIGMSTREHIVMADGIDRPIRVLDLFCGAGGSSWGAKQAGATPVAGIDLWPLATETYQLNFPEARVYTQDLKTLCPQRVRDDVGPIDLLLASPECTHHSVAKGAAPRSEASKQLAFQVVRFAEALQPRWIIVENVIQMRSWSDFPRWMNELENAGPQTYRLRHETLDAARFGVPQNRRRLFVVAQHGSEPSPLRKKHLKPKAVKSILPSGGSQKEKWKFTPLDNGRRAAATIERANRAMAELGKSEEFIMVYYGSDGAGGWQRIDRPLRTVTTLDRFALVRPNCIGHEMRMLQPPELAAAMGFPKRFRWPACSRRERIKLIGNAVCPPVISAIVRGLRHSARHSERC